MSQPQLVAELDNPAFLTLHPKAPLLYSCTEIRRDGKREGARLVACRIEKNGLLTPLNSQPTQGTAVLRFDRQRWPRGLGRALRKRQRRLAADCSRRHTQSSHCFEPTCGQRSSN